MPISWLNALMVCLNPTTIGGLLSAIGIAGMDRVTRFNVIAMSGKAVEACGDVDTMILDKTGTITYGNRLAAEFYPVKGVAKEDLTDYCVMCSLMDATPEGKSTVELGRNFGCAIDDGAADQMEFVEFTAQSKMSGVNLKDGTRVRKGASEAIKTFVKEAGGIIPSDLEGIVTEVSNLGGTPLVVCVNNKIVGGIYLKDTVKPGLVERFERLRECGIKTIMCTGDNPLTAATIAKEAGVSISTVSRVINNTKPVSPELKERVYRIIEKNHFTPNALAQGLITKKTNIVGVIVPDISNAVFGALTKGINSVCSNKGYTIM